MKRCQAEIPQIKDFIQYVNSRSNQCEETALDLEDNYAQDDILRDILKQ